MAIREIVFDCDGVLVKSLPLCIIEVNTVMATFGYPERSDDEIMEGFKKIFKEFLRINHPDVTFDMYLKRRNELGLDLVRVPRVEGSKRAIVELSKDHHLSIISNRDGLTLNEILCGSGHELDRFHYIQSASNSPHHKPDKRVFNAVIKKALDRGIRKEEIMYVGDMEVDYYATVNAGLHFTGVLTGGIKDKQGFIDLGAPAGNIIESLRELPDLVRSLR